MIHVLQQSCLEKIRPDTKSFKRDYIKASALSNEDFAYQVVLYSDDPEGESVDIELRGNGVITVYEVKQVTVNWPHKSSDSDPQYLIDKPALLPDAMIPLRKRSSLRILDHPTILWIGVRISMPGEHTIGLHINGELCKEFTLEILPHTLDHNVFDHCEYIDPCSISRYYGFPMFSSEHWQMLGKYFKIAAEHGVTRVLTPIYTPCYGDLPMGGCEIQLFKITKSNQGLVFNFDLLDTWITIAKKNGIKEFVFPPLIPSFETLECPKFKVCDGYREVDFFDKSCNVLSKEFSVSIRKFLRELFRHLVDIRALENVTMQFAHAPTVACADAYEQCRKIFDRLVVCSQIADTMPPPEFIDLKLGCVPFFSSAKIAEYLKYQHGRYLYWDIFDSNSVVNNLIAAPSMYIRQFGVIAFRYNISALFGLWFNNFCTPNQDRAGIVLDTSNEKFLPSGSGYLVYPGPNGPIPTLRLKQLYFALQDKRVIDKLSTIIARERIYSRIDKKYKISLDSPVIAAEKFLEFREEIYSLFEK